MKCNGMPRANAFTAAARAPPQGEPQIVGQQHDFEHDHPDAAAIDLRKQQLDRNHRDERGEPHHRAPGRGEPEPDRRHQIDHRKEHGRRLVGRGIAFETDRRGGVDAAHDRPVVESLDERQARHRPHEQDEARRPFVRRRLAFAGMHRLERPRLLGDEGIGHGRSSSAAIGANAPTSPWLTDCSEDGCQRGVRSLSMITDRIPS